MPATARLALQFDSSVTVAHWRLSCLSFSASLIISSLLRFDPVAAPDAEARIVAPTDAGEADEIGALGALLTMPAAAQTVTDGDTIKLDGITYRIWRIDAAEIGMPVLTAGWRA